MSLDLILVHVFKAERVVLYFTDSFLTGPSEIKTLKRVPTPDTRVCSF